MDVTPAVKPQRLRNERKAQNSGEGTQYEETECDSDDEEFCGFTPAEVYADQPATMDAGLQEQFDDNHRKTQVVCVLHQSRKCLTFHLNGGCNNKKTEKCSWIPAVGMAASVLLRNRSPYMNAVQLVLGIFLYHSNWAPAMSRFAPLLLVTSPTHLYKKLEEFGKGYDKAAKEMVQTDRKWFAEVINKEQGSSQEEVSTSTTPKPSLRFKLTIDVDYDQNVHYTTEENQNVDKHYVTVNATTNRVSGNHLSTMPPLDGILKTFKGVTFESENHADGIQKILKELHQYVPYAGEGDERKYCSQGIVCDQLTVEQVVNAHMTLSNGFTPEERMDGLHCGIADWHAGNKALNVLFSHLYNPVSAADKCTMFSDRNLINRRSVKDVDSAVNANRRFFTLEIQSHVVAAGMIELGMESIEEEPDTLNNVETWNNKDKKEYLTKLSTSIVDKYILDKVKHKKIAKAVKQLEERELRDSKDRTLDGRYKYRFPGCKKTFQSDGKWRQSHEQSHSPPVSIQEQPLLTEIHDDVVQDDMYNYQKALLNYGMVILNFFDAISEGDGTRIIRNWKFLLLYLHHDKGSYKYALEGLYLLFQINALLSPKAAHQLTWNRFSKRKNTMGGNIPLDLALEFINRVFKDVVKKLGPNASKKSIARISHALGITKQLTDNFDESMLLYKRSGKHVRKLEKADMEKKISELLSQNALTITPGRSYGCFSKIKEVAPKASSSNATQTFWTKDIKVAREAYETVKGDQATNFLKEWKKVQERSKAGSRDSLQENEEFLYIIEVKQAVANS
ncbi:Hypothetical predicted protein [Paramuricea clavata]|uniref:DUF6589 domain-containing protein n=1 Tax=Paramuricea clavata TaxID=317549 RepID=A0A6S7G0E2_PARCT|nr:Hypothetical predicted protein [Paramuricea clavata]